MAWHVVRWLVVASLLAGCAAPVVPVPEGEVRFPGVRIETRLGAFTAILFPAEAPLTTAFFSKLVDAKYYDGRAFGRVIPGFVIQEVDRTGGTTDQKETVKLEAGTRVHFSAGAFGIARDADPDSGGSEFFVMDFAFSRLHGNYTAFAQVVGGQDVVHAIARVPAVETGPASLVSSPPGSPVYFGVHDRVPVEPVVMTRVSRVEVVLPAEEAARYPLRVGETVRTETLIATLEWPADLRAGHASRIAWYLLARDTSPTASAQDPPPPDLRGARVVVANETLVPTEDAKAPGALSFAWTPPSPGLHTLRLVKDGRELVAADVTVER